MKLSALSLISFVITGCIFGGCDKEDGVYAPDMATILADSTLMPTNEADFVNIEEVVDSHMVSSFSTFFDNHASCFFTGCKQNEDACFIVNSKFDITAIYKGSWTMPEVDFTKYTLIIGKNYLPNGYVLLKKKLKQFGTQCILELHYMLDDGTFLAMMDNYYYYALFPKLSYTSFGVITNRIPY